MTRYIFDSDAEIERHRINELKRRRKSKWNLHIKNAELPDDYPKNWTAQEKVDYLVNLNRNNRPKWMN